MKALRERVIDERKYIRLAYSLYNGTEGAGRWWPDTTWNISRLERLKKACNSEFGPHVAWVETMEHD